MTRAILLASAFFGLAAGAVADPIPQGTRIEVRCEDSIDVRGADNGRIYSGTVAQDVMDADGRVKIPRGSRTELIVRRTGPNDLSVDLESVMVEGRRYAIDSQATERTRGQQGLGENRRTGEYVGGGAVIGSILGAIAGGGKGAAIGAVAGGAAGAGTQVITRGQAVRIPAESILTFRLERPLDIYADRGEDRDGRHYHSYSPY